MVEVKNLSKRVLPLCAALVLIGCEKEELPVDPYPRGDAEDAIVEMKANYENQVWFDMGSGEAVSTNLKTDWDIALDCSDTATNIYLNSAVGMKVALSNTNDFAASIDAGELEYHIDHSSGLQDSIAITDWWTTDNLWVIDMGYDEDGKLRGKRKAQFILTDDQTLVVKHASLNGTEVQEAILIKDNRFNATALQFKTNETLQIEPAKEDFDLVFTQYLHTFYQPRTDYLVTGAILNKHKVRVIELSDTAFEDVDISVLDTHEWNDSLDVIGYDWKYYDFSSATYTVNDRQVYVLKDTEGFYYKLHFTSFYSPDGEKGFPNIRYQRL